MLVLWICSCAFDPNKRNFLSCYSHLGQEMTVNLPVTILVEFLGITTILIQKTFLIGATSHV